MNLLDRPSRQPVQLNLSIEPTSLTDAVGRVASEYAVSPRTIAACSPIQRPGALLWAHRWVERCDRVIDVGSGLGGRSVFLHQMRTGPMTLVEPDPVSAEHARIFTALETVTAPLDSLPFSDGLFGGAVALAPHGHGPERAGMLPELGRVVRSGGHVSLWTCVSDAGAPYDTSTMRFPTLSQLEAELYAAGLEVDSWAAADRFDAERTWREIQHDVRQRVVARYGTLPASSRAVAEADAVGQALELGSLTSLAYRLVVR